MLFFQGFTLDTLLGTISVLLGVVALFLGGTAYKEYKGINKSLNDTKTFGDSCEDSSQKAGRDIINNNCDTEALMKMTSDNFEICLNHAYDMFKEQSNTNLKSIIEETKRIVNEQKPNLAGLTKIDWINIYFESAKNTSDEYMQRIWAKVLAKEMEHPGSFSYKTLDVLKNMSSNDFHLFERMCSLSVDNRILQEDIYAKYGLRYLDLIKMSENGLLSMHFTTSKITINPKESINSMCGDVFVIIENESDEEIKYSLEVYLLTSAAVELKNIVEFNTNINFMKDYVAEVQKKSSKVKISLHRIIKIEGSVVTFQQDEL